LIESTRRRQLWVSRWTAYSQIVSHFVIHAQKSSDWQRRDGCSRDGFTRDFAQYAKASGRASDESPARQGSNRSVASLRMVATLPRVDCSAFEGQGRLRSGATDPVFETGGQAVLTKTCPPVRLGSFRRRRLSALRMNPRTLAIALGRGLDVATGGRSRKGRLPVGWGSLSEAARCEAVAPVVL